MLTSANQYLRPEYLTPLPITLDAKKSPLALLALTCSSIGSDSSPNQNKSSAAGASSSSSSVESGSSPGKKSKSHRKSPSSSSQGQGHSKEKPHSQRKATKSPEHLNVSNNNSGQSSPESLPSTPVCTPPPLSIKSSRPPSVSVSACSSSGKRSPEDSPHNFSSSQNKSKKSAIKLNLNGHSADLSSLTTSSTVASTTTGTGIPAYLHSYSYARLKATNSTGDSLPPFSTHPSSCSSFCPGYHLPGQSGKCCSQSPTYLNHPFPPIPGFPQHLPPSFPPLSSFYPPPSHPYLCNWISGSDFCGKKFASSEELLQHLRSAHTNSQNPADLFPGGFPPAASHALLNLSLGRSYPSLSPHRYHPYASSKSPVSGFSSGAPLSHSLYTSPYYPSGYPLLLGLSGAKFPHHQL